MKTTKIILIMAGAVALSTSVNAQKYGIRAGLNIATVTGQDGNITPRNAFYAGFFKEVTLIPKLFYLQPEVQYSSQGFKSEILNSETEYTIDYINVPLLAKVYILKTFSLEAGPQLGFKIHDNYDPITGNDIETFDPGFAAGIGFNFPFGLFAEARYAKGFKEIIKDSEAKNQVIQLGVGFKF